MELKDVFAALRAHWLMPVVAVVLGAAAALAYSLSMTPMYSAKTQFFIATTDSSSSSEALQGSQFSQLRVASYAQLLTGEDFAKRVIGRLELDEDPQDVSARITAIPVADTVLINVTVDDPIPQQAQQIAEGVGDEFTELVTELETPDGGGTSPVKVTVTDRPDLPTAPSRPDVFRTVAIGALGGLLLGAAGAVLRHLLRRDGQDPDMVTDAAARRSTASVPEEGGKHRFPRSTGPEEGGMDGQAPDGFKRWVP